MSDWKVSRRELLAQGSAAALGMALFHPSLMAQTSTIGQGERIIPFLDQPAAPAPADAGMNLLKWEDLNSWITPNPQFFYAWHYDQPVLSEKDWKLQITGLVKRPMTLSLADIKARQRQETIFTMECSGNDGLKWFRGGVGNAKWAGTALAPLLKEAGVMPGALEVVFTGSDEGEEQIREFLDDIRPIKMKQNFARSMSIDDAMDPHHLLCYEMNGDPLPSANGFPLRLIAPGWFGIANVKWLKRIEVRNTRLMNRFMARDYVTIREEDSQGRKVWTETSVGRALIKSMTAKVTRRDGRYRIDGAAWGAPIARVEVRIDNGPWMAATIDRSHEAEFAWKFWSLDWERLNPGEHTIVSRAIDTKGAVQPAMDDPRIAKKHTYWESNGQITRRIRIS